MEHVGKCLICFLSFLAGEEHSFLGSVQKNLTVVKEIDLEKFVAETKHDSMSCFEPLFDVNKAIVIFEFGFLDLHFLDLFIEVDDESF